MHIQTLLVLVSVTIVLAVPAREVIFLHSLNLSQDLKGQLRHARAQIAKVLSRVFQTCSCSS
ncbi:hypothetical protein LY78DRAFT_698048 [Colletotrichum sublineola]|nr:hypothetical protein LY78DRAFT_698048 [Colletotrichum sublineola]